MSPLAKNWCLGLILALVAVAGTAVAARTPADSGKVTPLRYELKEIGRFVAPTHVTAPPGDTRRLFVVEKAGRIRVVLDGRVLARPFLDLTALVKSDGGEQGLLSLAFAPDYATSGNFYVYYVDRDENARVVEYRRSAASANRADPATRREVLLVPGFGEHYGGLLLFGPDGVLHLGVGDGGLEQNRDPLRAQRDGELHGKILSVDPTTGATEAWVKGLRNPWRYWVDATTQDLWVGDVGEYVRESIDYVPGPNVAGANLGWPCFEGALARPEYPPELCPGARAPLLDYAREGGNCAVIAGVVVRDSRLPALTGRFLYADLCLGEVIAVAPRGDELASARSLRLYRPGITSFGQDARGRVYLTTISGPVYRLDPRGSRGAATGARRPSSGRELYLAAGCGTCHSLTAAQTAGTYGPNLDDASPSRALVIERVTWGKGAMPSFKGRLTAPEIERLADFVSSRAGR